MSGHWEDRALVAMGSPARVIAGEAPAGVVDWALQELVRLERCWSRFDPRSELTALNADPRPTVEVSATLLRALARAVDGWWATAGWFDPSVLDALEANGYDRTFDEVPARRAGPPGTVRPPGLAGVVVDETTRRVHRPAGLRFDLGGVGKGLAADLLAEGLIDRGARSSCVGLGGDVRVAGTTDGSPWPIPVEDPFVPGAVTRVQSLENGAVVTSTRLLRTWWRGDRPQHHLVDPRSGRSAWSGVAAVVVADATAARAEVFAKAALVAGPRRGLDLLQGAGLEGWLHLDDGTVRATTAGAAGRVGR